MLSANLKDNYPIYRSPGTFNVTFPQTFYEDLKLNKIKKKQAV